MSARSRSTEDGGYELLSHLASGGMAELFLARRSKDGCDAPVVVLKRILPAHVRNQDFVSMFLDEARLASRLNHVNIARVLEVGRLADTYFYAMEYVRGKNAREVLARAAMSRTRITPTLTVSVLVDVATGLHAAHDQRDLRGQPLEIVHRDVSPANVMIGFDGKVKIVDFGVAKAADRMTQTQSGTIKGKTAYLSPEQCRGKAIDRRSDIFSLGIVAWELLTQRRLFRYDNDYDTMDAIMNERIAPPSEVAADVPRAIDAVIARALARAPAERFATAAEFATALITALGRPRASDATAQLAEFMASLFGEPPKTVPVATLAATLGSLDVSVIGTGESEGEGDTNRRDPSSNAETDRGPLRPSPTAIPSAPVTPAPPPVAPGPPKFNPARTLPLAWGSASSAVTVPRRASTSPVVTSPTAMASATLMAATVPPPARTAAAPAIAPRPVAPVSPVASTPAITRTPAASTSPPAASTRTPAASTSPPITSAPSAISRAPAASSRAPAASTSVPAASTIIGTAAAFVSAPAASTIIGTAAAIMSVPAASTVTSTPVESTSAPLATTSARPTRPPGRRRGALAGGLVMIAAITAAAVIALGRGHDTPTVAAGANVEPPASAAAPASEDEATGGAAAPVPLAAPIAEGGAAEVPGEAERTLTPEDIEADVVMEPPQVEAPRVEPTVPRPSAGSARTARKQTADEVRTQVREAISRDDWPEALARCKQAAAELQPIAVCAFAACMSGLTSTAISYASRLSDQQRRNLEKACAGRNHPIADCEDPTRCGDFL